MLSLQRRQALTLQETLLAKDDKHYCISSPVYTVSDHGNFAFHSWETHRRL